MQYKVVDNSIVCTCKNGIMQAGPETYQFIDDDRIPWLNTENEIIRLQDFSFVFADDIRALQDLHLSKLTELETSFDNRVSGSFVCTLGWPMQFDRSDTLAVEGAIQLMKANAQSTGYLTDANDETHYDLPLATMEAVKVEMLSAYAQCHARKQELRAVINAAQNEEELNAIEITWPV